MTQYRLIKLAKDTIMVSGLLLYVGFFMFSLADIKEAYIVDGINSIHLCVAVYHLFVCFDIPLSVWFYKRTFNNNFYIVWYVLPFIPYLYYLHNMLVWVIVIVTIILFFNAFYRLWGYYIIWDYEKRNQLDDIPEVLDYKAFNEQ